MSIPDLYDEALLGADLGVDALLVDPGPVATAGRGWNRGGSEGATLSSIQYFGGSYTNPQTTSTLFSPLDPDPFKDQNRIQIRIPFDPFEKLIITGNCPQYVLLALYKNNFCMLGLNLL